MTPIYKRTLNAILTVHAIVGALCAAIAILMVITLIVEWDRTNDALIVPMVLMAFFGAPNKMIYRVGCLAFFIFAGVYAQNQALNSGKKAVVVRIGLLVRLV